MRPRHALTIAVAVVGGIALVWCAWLVLRADLTAGTTLATVLLWILAAAAVVTLAAYAREVERHHGRRSRRGGSVKPLPGLVLLWVGGLTALVAFPFMLSGTSAAGATTADPDVARPGAVDTPSGTPATPRTSPTAPSRSSTRTPSPSSTTSARRTAATPTPTTSTPRSTTGSATSATSPTATSTPSPTTTTTTGPVIHLPLPTPTKTKRH